MGACYSDAIDLMDYLEGPIICDILLSETYVALL